MENQSSSMELFVLVDYQMSEVSGDALSQWELIDVLDAEEGGENRDDGDSVHSGFGSWNSSISLPGSPNDNPIEGIHDDPLPDVDVEDGRGFVDDDGNGDRHFNYVDDENRGFRFDDCDADGNGGGQVEDEGDNDDGYDLNDELVPWSVSSKFGRQRMRKLGKRAFPKMHNSKRSPYLFVRPGCVRGKHGLGLKHNY